MSDNPYVGPHFTAFNRALLDYIDSGEPADEDSAAFSKISDDMPELLKAFLYALAAGATPNLGGWAFQDGYAEYNFADEMEDIGATVDLGTDNIVCLGKHFDHELDVFATWTTPDAPFDLITVAPPSDLQRWGDFESFLELAKQRDMLSEDEMDELDELRALVREYERAQATT